MKRTVYSFYVLFLSLASLGYSTNVEKPKKPNVILIITDDQGFGDLGYYGNPHVKTPVLDDLAKRSVRFDEFLVSPVCAPTRASLMTGRYAMRTGVHDTYHGGSMMAASELTIAELLKKAKYKTGMIGKWHLGDNYPMRPQDQGFDYTLNHLSGGIGQSGDWPNATKGDSSYFNPILWKNGAPYQSKGYCSDVFGEAAINFVTENKDQPFFLYLSFNAPHTPLQVPQSYYDMYKDIDPTEGFENDSRPFPAVHDKAKEYARKVYGMVSNIDDNLGRLFKKLEELKIDDNTLIIFMTDNGPQDPRYIAGMKGRKGSVFQGGVRVPSFWYYPEAFKEARDISTPTMHHDVLPTLAAFCGVEIPENIQLDGANLLPLLKKEKTDLPQRSINNYWHRDAPVKYKNVSTRKDHLKLVGTEKNNEGKDLFELYDIKNDPYELNDISESHQKEVETLKLEMDEWLNDMFNSENFINSPKPIIGTKHENPVVLNLNDGIFSKDEILKKQTVSWDATIAKAGNYTITVHFFNEIKEEGELQLKIGALNKSVDLKKVNTNQLVAKNVKLPLGDITIFPKVLIKKEGNDAYVMPFYVEVKK